MTGELRIVEDVPAAFADLVSTSRPHTIALSGGSTAERCYRELAARPDMDWEDVEVLISDERWVPVDHADSNEGMARRELLDGVPVKAVHSLRGSGDTPDEAADAYDRLVVGFPAIDLIHLGLGEDGHTASLFPDSPALRIDDRYVIATGDDLHEWPRLTFTYPAISLGRLVVFTVSGAGKAEALRRVHDGDTALPASSVEADDVVWLVDQEAAGLIR